MCYVLCQLGFLPNKPNIDAVDQQLCQDLWSLVKGEERGGVAFETLKVAFLNFIGIKTLDRERPLPHNPDET